MISLALIHELFAYNYWARDQQLAACGALTPEQFVRPLGELSICARYAGPFGGR